MSLLRKAVDTALNHARSILANRKRIADLVEQNRLTQASLEELRAPLGSPQHMPYSLSELAMLMMVESVSGTPPRWEAIRLQRSEDGTQWEPDEDDVLPTTELPARYRVMPAPGIMGFFPGCRCLCALSHVEEYVDPDTQETLERGVYVPVQGEAFGFAALITGSELVSGGAGDESDRQYTWEQLGLDAADKYTNESDPLEEGEFGLAIHEIQAWMGKEDGVQIDRRSLTGLRVFMWYSNGVFRFNSPRERQATDCNE